MKRDLCLYILICFISSHCCDSEETEDDVPMTHVPISWWNVGKLFHNIANNGLYRRELKDVIENDLTWQTKKIDPNDVLQQPLSKVEAILMNKMEALIKFNGEIIEFYPQFKSQEPEVHCCKRKSKGTTGNNGCFHGKGLSTSLIATLPKKLLERMKNIVRIYENVNILYMSLTDGGFFYYPDNNWGRHKKNVPTCLDYHADIRPWYTVAESPQPRDVVLLMDMNPNELPSSRQLNKDVLVKVLRSLSTEDRIAIATKILQMNGENAWLLATPRNINNLIHHLEEVATNNDNRTIRELYDFKNLKDRLSTVNYIFSNPIKLSIHISRPEAVKVLVQITSRSELINCTNNEVWTKNNITIITYYTGLVDILPKNCTNMIHIETATSLDIQENKLSHFFKWSDYFAKKKSSQVSVRMTMPYSSSLGFGTVFSLVVPIIINETFYGVAGTSFRLTDYTTDVESILGVKDSYSFLINNQGRVLFHPFLPSPLCSLDDDKVKRCQEPTLEFIYHLELEEEVHNVIQSMVDMEKGNKTVIGNIVFSTGHGTKNMSNLIALKPLKLLYLWTPLVQHNLSLAVVLPLYDNKVFNVSFTCPYKHGQKSKLLYHDKMNSSDLIKCNHFGAVVLKEEAVIQFASSMFRDYIPRWISSTEDPILKALKDGKSMTTALKGEQVTHNLKLLELFEGIWQNGLSLNCLIGIRYASTPDGMMMSYPGTRLSTNFDSRTRSWYQSGVAAMNDWTTMALTLPYRDFFSGGKVITLVTPLQKEFDSGLSVLVAMAAADFSIEFLKKKLRHELSINDKSEVNCFLMDTFGYIPLHLKNDAASGTHITEMEPIIAENLINANFLRRTGCHDFEQDLWLLYWSFELSCDVTTYSSTESEIVFSLYRIPSMNLYLVAYQNLSAPINIKETPTDQNILAKCSSTCTKTVEPPCKVMNNVRCEDKKQDMQSTFSSMPACLPNYNRHKDVSPKHCESTEKDNCYNSTISQCDDWLPDCPK